MKSAAWRAMQAEHQALRKRTAAALTELSRFADADFPVRVGEPCPHCGSLFWAVVGKADSLAPMARCVACLPPPRMWRQRPDLVLFARTHTGAEDTR